MRLAAAIAPLAVAVLVVASASSAPVRAAGGGVLAYSSELRTSEVYVMDANRQGVKRLTDDVAPDRWPALSPDGSKVAYARKRNGSWGIFVMNVRDGSVEDLSAEAGLAPGFEGYPDWSPDGTKLAFSAQAHYGGPIDILVYDFASKSTQDLTADSSNDLRPRWSPDGTKIVFGGSGSVGGLDVYTVTADGSVLACFVIDLSVSGAAVSADVVPQIGTVLAVGKVVGRVARYLPGGFAVEFVATQNRHEVESLVIRG